MEISKENYFKRQTTLSEIGKAGQTLLQKAKVLIIGCGGLGSPLAIYLATSGVGQLHLVDFDSVSVSNLHRQVFYKLNDVNKSKAEILAEEIKLRTPFTTVTFSNTAVDKNSILELISNYDVIVDGTDSLQIKYLINDACVLKGKPLVYGSLYKFDGYVATFNVPLENGTSSCNLRDAFPTIATDIPNCEEAGTMNPIVGIIALLQANEVLKLITKKGKLLLNELLIYNALENTQFKIKLQKNTNLDFEQLFNESNYEDDSCRIQQPNLLISSKELQQKIGSPTFEIISVINNIEVKIPFEVHKKLPYATFDINVFQPNIEKTYVIVCQKGISSYDIVLKIKKQYPLLTVLSLEKGIENY